MYVCIRTCLLKISSYVGDFSSSRGTNKLWCYDICSLKHFSLTMYDMYVLVHVHTYLYICIYVCTPYNGKKLGSFEFHSAFLLPFFK